MNVMGNRAASIPDPRDVPTYDLAEVAHYLRMPKSTLRAWFCGQGRFQPVLEAARTTRPVALSFFNVAEAHVLNAMRREHEIPLQRVRDALDTVTALVPDSSHPLIDQRFETDGVDLFIRRYGELLNLSRPNQEFMREVLNEHLRRIEFGQDNLPDRLYPFSGTSFGQESKTILIDPRIAFGRRVVAGTGIPTRAIGERYAAGETIDALADDYRLPRTAIEDAIRSEYELTAA